MSDMKKYTDVVRYGHKSTTGVLTPGDHIVVQEKLDGANASFRVIDGEIVAYSRNTQLDAHNTLRGFYEWTRTLDASKLLPNIIYFGEWLVSHKVQYPASAMNKFYLFDLFDTVTQKYLAFDDVMGEAARLGLTQIPVFYVGPYQGYDHLQAFVGDSAFDVRGEGIVVKNVDYTNQYGHQMHVKLVSPEFAEVQKQKLPKDPAQTTPEQQFVDTYATAARVEKFLHKLVDENVLDAQFGIEDMGTILKELNTRIYDDLLKEESDYLPQDYDEKVLRRAINKTLSTQVKEIIQTREVVLV